MLDEEFAPSIALDQFILGCRRRMWHFMCQIPGPNGTQEFSGGTIDGDSLSWVVDLTQPMAIRLEFSAKVDGDNIGGDVKLGSFGNATFTGTREA